MGRKLLAGAIGLIGLTLLLGAGIARFRIAHQASRWPSDRTIERTYEGTLTHLEPLGVGGDGVEVTLRSGVSVTVKRTVTTESIDGSLATAREAEVITSEEGVIREREGTFTLDRESRELVDAAGAPFGGGLIPGWPSHVERRDVGAFDEASRSTYTWEYSGEQVRQGRETLVFTAELERSRLVDDRILAILPNSLAPESLESLGASPAYTGRLSYEWSLTGRQWIDAVTGTVIDLEWQEATQASAAPGPSDTFKGPPPWRLDDIYQLTLTATDASVDAAVREATSLGNDLRTWRLVVPLALLAGGAFLLSLAIALWFVRSKDANSTTLA